MKYTALLLAGASVLVASPATAREGLYIGVEGGVRLEDQVDIDLADTDPQTNAAFADIESGFDVDAIIGYDFGMIRVEGEVGYKQNPYDTLTVVNPAFAGGAPVGTVVSPDGNFSVFSGMVNALLDLGKDNGVNVYFGGGIGLANVKLDLTAPGVGTLADDNQSDFAYQAIAGLRFPVSDSIDLGVKYRYFWVDEFDFDAIGGAPIEVDNSGHSVLASVVYNFGRKAAAPPPPPPPPAPPPPPPPPPAPRPAPPPPPVVQCNTGPYIVFFDFDQSAITSEAAQTLNTAVTSYGNCGTARVMLAGHTDRAGSQTYNIALAERRNASVREYLVGRGIPAARIMSEAFGEANPLVPTQDGVREQQNRRVEVTYGPGSGM